MREGVERTGVVVGSSPLHFFNIHGIGVRGENGGRFADRHSRSICFSIVSRRSSITSTRLEAIRSMNRFTPKIVNRTRRQIRMRKCYLRTERFVILS